MSKFLNSFLKFTGVSKTDSASSAAPSRTTSPTLEDEEDPIDPFVGIVHQFSVDADGHEIEGLWNELIAIDKADTNSVSAAFLRFGELFVQKYSRVNFYAAQAGTRRSSAVLINRIDSIDATIAHPQEVVVYVAHALMEYIGSSTSSSRGHLASAPKPVCCRDEDEEAAFQRMINLEFPHKIRLNRVFRIETSDPLTDALREDRRALLLTLSVFGIICRWPQNVRKLKELVGQNILVLFTEIFNVFHRKLGELVDEIREKASTIAATAGSDLSSLDGAMLDDIVFCLDALMIGAQFCAHASPGLAVGSTMSRMGVTPTQPWLGSALNSLAFPAYTARQPTADSEDTVPPFYRSVVSSSGPYRLVPPGSDFLCLATGAVSWVEKLNCAAEGLRELLASDDEAPVPLQQVSFVFRHQLPLLLTNLLAVQTEALFGYLCLLLSALHHSGGADLAAVLKVWATQEGALVNGLVLPPAPVLSARTWPIARDILFQRGLLSVKINHLAVLAQDRLVQEAAVVVPPKAMSSRKGKSADAKPVATAPALSTFSYEDRVFGAMLSLFKWLHLHGYRPVVRSAAMKEFNCPDYDPKNVLAEPCKPEAVTASGGNSWVGGLCIQAVGPFSFRGTRSGCDLWPWCSSTEGDDSFFGGPYNACYRLCSFNSTVSGESLPVADRGNDASGSSSRGQLNQSYLYMKDAPVFMIASSGLRLGAGSISEGGSDGGKAVTPPWFAQSAVGRAWEISFAVVLGVCFGAYFNPAGKATAGLFADAAALQRLGTVFGAVVRAVASCFNDPSSSNSSELPVLQCQTLVFLVRCFKQAPVELVALCRHSHVVDMLLGDYFVGGGARETAYLLAGNFATTEIKPQASSSGVESGGGVSRCSEVVLSVNIDAKLHGGHREELDKALAWVFVHDASLDVVRCLLGAASSVTKEHMEACHFTLVPGGLRKDVALLLQALTRARTAPAPMDDVVFQLVRLLSFTIDDPAMSRDLSDVTCRCLTGCLDLVAVHMEAVGVRSSYPHDPFHHEAVVRVETRRPFLWLARSATLRLVSKLVSLSKNEWVECFLQDVAVRERERSTTVERRGPEDSVDSEAHQSVSRSTSSADSVWSVATAASVNNAGPVPGTPLPYRPAVSSSSSRPRGYYHIVASLLYDRRCRDVAIYVLIKLLVTCGLEATTSAPGTAAAGTAETVAATGAAQLSRGRATLRILACDIVQSLLFFVGYSSKHSPWCDSYTTSCVVLRSLTCMLRNRRYGSVRSCLQDFFRKGDSIAHILDVLKNCTRPSASAQTALAEYKLDVPALKLQILRQGLALLTAIMLGNSACKSEFKYVMSSSPSAAVQSSSSSSRSGGSSGAADRLSTVSEKSVAPGVRERSVSTVSTSNISSTSSTGGSNLTSSSSFSAAKFTRYHNFKLMLLQAEPEPTLETFALLIEMLLDAPCLNTRTFLQETGGDPEKVLQGAFANNDDRPRILNYCVVPCIMCLVPHCSEALQICIINTLHNLVTGRASLVNLANVSQSSPLMLDLVMDLFPVISDRVQAHAGKFMETLGQYSLSVAQLKHMFRLIHSEGEFRPSYSWRLLHALQGMVTEEQGPRHFFVFEGTNSGLLLPPIVKWPCPRAFTVCLWLRISPQLDMYDAQTSGSNLSLHVVPSVNIRTGTEYSPYLLCLRSNSGQGVEIFLNQVNKTSGKYNIVVQTFSETGEKSSFTPAGKNMMVTDGEWHFLSLTLSVSSALSLNRKSEACLMLDDSCERVPLHFPAFSEPIMEPLIGECVSSVRLPTHNTTMRGQMGAFYLFSEALAVGQLHGIRELGPNYFYCFEPATGLEDVRRDPKVPPKPGAAAAVDVLDGSLTQLVALTFNPAVWSLDYFLDNTPDKNPVKWRAWAVDKSSGSSSTGSARGEGLLGTGGAAHSGVDVLPLPGKMHARRILPGTYRSSTQNVRMALDSLGGLKAVFPLFVQLDQPRLFSRAVAQSAEAQESGDSLDQNFCITVLELLHTLLDNSVENQALLQKLHGLQLVAYFLERVSPLHLSSTALDIIIKLYDRLSWTILGQNSIVESLLCNFKLWVFTPYEVQYKLFNWLVMFTEQQPNRMREIIGAQRLVDDLYMLYGYDLPHSEAGVEQKEAAVVLSPSVDRDEAGVPVGADTKRSLKGTIYMTEHFTSQTGQASGERLPPVQLKRVRGYILHMLYTVMTVGDAPFPEDIEGLIEYITVVVSATAKIEGLRLLLHLMNQGSDSSTPSRVLVGLACCYGVQTLLPLHSHPSAQVRMYALLIFCKVVNLAGVYRLLPAIPAGSKYHRLVQHTVDSEDELPIPPPPPPNADWDSAKAGRTSSLGSDLEPRGSTSFFPAERRSRAASWDHTQEDREHEHVASPLSPTHKRSMLKKLSDMSSFEALGMPPSTLVGTLLWLQEQLMDKISDDVGVVMMSDSASSTYNRQRNYSSSSAGGGSMGSFPLGNGLMSASPQVLLQCKIIAAALQLTLLGAPCDHLAIEVDKLFSQAVEDSGGRSGDNSLPGSPDVGERKASNGPDDDRLPPLSSLSSLPGRSAGSGHIVVDGVNVSQRHSSGVQHNMNDVLYSLHKVEYSEILSTLFPGRARTDSGPLNRTLSDARICVPMIFPSLLLFLRHENISHSLRLSILVNIKLLLSLENCEKILKIPAWQNYVFQLIASESVRLEKLQSVKADERDNRSISKAEGVIDTCVRMICDIICTAVKIGRHLGPSEVTRPDDPYEPSYELLDLVSSVGRGERQLGVTVLRETIAYLRVHADRKLLNANKLAYELLKQTIDQVQHDKESESSYSASSSKADSDRGFAAKLLDLNTWLLASIVLEVVAFNDSPVNARMSVSRSASPIRQMSVTGNASELDSALKTIGSTSEVDETDAENMWNLVLLLLKLLRPMEEDPVEYGAAGGSPHTDEAQGKRLLVKGVAQMGIAGSTRAVININDNVDMIVPNVAASSVTGNRARAQSSHPPQGPKNILILDKSTTVGMVGSLFAKAPLLHAAGGVSWIMIRVLCTVFAQGGDVVNVGNSEAGDSTNRPLAALVQLKNLINVLKAQELEHFEFECLHVTARLVDSLRRTALGGDSEWVRGALGVVAELSSGQSDILKHLVCSAARMTNESVHRFPLIASMVSRIQQPVPRASPARARPAPSRTGTVAELTKEALLQSLTLPGNVEFTWELWDAAMGVVFDDAQQMEDAIIAQKFTELGMHRYSQEMRTQLVAKCQLETRLAVVLVRDCEQAQRIAVDQQTKHMWEMLKGLESQRKRCKTKWTRIVQEVANERGPWGSGADNQLQSGTFWILDATESDRRIRHQLRRNEYGCEHRTASLLQRGIYSNKGGVLSLVGASASGVAHGMGGSSGTGGDTDPAAGADSDNAATDGLWKDLVKYKGKEVATDADEDGGGSDEEENPEASSSGRRGGDKDRDKEDHNSNAFASTLYNAVTVGSDRVLFSCPCQVITVASSSSGGTTLGTIEIYRTKITFTRSHEEHENAYTFANKTGNPEFQWVALKYPSTTWQMSEVRNVFQRHFQLRFVGIELFFTSRTSALFNLFEIKDAKEFYNTICRKVKPPNLVVKTARKPKNAIQKSFLPGSSRTLTQAWVNREISNFDYLMQLNTIAGRSFHDMSNYPVFPWVIADYTSKRLDLRNPKTFRNFRYPMGAQTESAREFFHEKYRDLQANYEDELEMSNRGIEVDLLPPYHYGSHYSCMGFIVWYMLRLEPFTSLHVWLQDGKFDKPDRLFDSVEQAYIGCTTNQADVKELIPEFFCCPEIFDNCNNVDLGTRQNGQQINNVQLPPWARNAQEFVRINREALESDYVSKHLHHWVDLVFGYKQRPPHLTGGSEAAVEACNVFFFLTYSDAIDLEALRKTDKSMYDQTVRRIDNFGQTPIMLFDAPHPQRASFEKVDIIWPIASAVWGADTIPKGLPMPEKPRAIICFKEYPVSVNPVVFIAELRGAERLVTVDASRIIGYHSWQVRQPDVVPPYALKLDNQALRYSQGLGAGLGISAMMGNYNNTARDKRVGVPLASQVVISIPNKSAVTPFVTRAKLDGSVESVSNKESFEDEEAARQKKRQRVMQGGSSSGSSRGSNAPVSESSHSRKTSSQSSSSSGQPVMGSSSVRQRRADDCTSTQLFAALPESRLLFSCGHWDSSFKVTAADSGRLIQSIGHRSNIVSCIATASDFGQHWLVTGSRDCTVIVWEVCPERTDAPVNRHPLHVLYGHDDVVTTVAINAELDIVVSGSEDGTVILYSLREGTYIRSIVAGSTAPQPVPISSVAGMYQNMSPSTNSAPTTPTAASRQQATPGLSPTPLGDVGTLAARKRVHWVGVTKDAFIIMYSNDGNLLFSYTLNGKLMAIREAGDRLYAFCLSEDGKVLLTGGERRLVVFRWTRTLDLANDGPRSGVEGVIDGAQSEEGIEPFSCPIRSICLSSQERHLLVGLENGNVRILAQDSDYLRRRLHFKLMEIGILPQTD